VTQWLWQAANGAVTNLADWGVGAYVTTDGTVGELAPSYTFADQQFVGVDGATLQQISADPRSVVLSVDFVATSTADLQARVRSLAHALRPRAGIGALQAVADDGTSRTLPCYYRKGLEAGTYRATRYKAALEFWAPNPWWRGTPLSYTWSLAAPQPFFPIPPVVLSATTISGVSTFDLSDTDSQTYPLWTATGPGSQLTLTNQTTGQTLVLNATIGDGQQVTIDTRPGMQAIRRVSDGASLFGSLASDPALWPLVDGVNQVQVLMTNAGAASSIAFTADRLYSGAR
jgi:hypothetical protein